MGSSGYALGCGLNIDMRKQCIGLGAVSRKVARLERDRGDGGSQGRAVVLQTGRRGAEGRGGCVHNGKALETLLPRGKRSTGIHSHNTFATRDRRGRYSRLAEGDSISLTVHRIFYANPVRPLHTGLLYVLHHVERTCVKHK